MSILSIQSHVAYGHVGNSAAVFPLQRLGFEVWPVHTVQFSNHPGHGAFRGEVFAPAATAALVEGIAALGVLSRCEAVLSGYLGAAETGEAVLEAVRLAKAANPAALYCCDPVIGDTGRGIYVRPGVPEFLRDRALAAADILTPNHFELEWLAGGAVTSHEGLLAALAGLHRLGPGVVCVTSLRLEDTPGDALDLVVSTGSAIYRLRTPRLDCEVSGAGDVTAALFLGHYLKTRDAVAALESAAASVYGLIRQSHAAGSGEIALIAAQAEIVAPGRTFSAMPF
jgi:pyridoxine kinase